MKYIVFLCWILILASCDGSSEPKLLQTRDDASFNVVLNLVEESKITDKCTSLGVEYEANGCSTFNLDTKVCTIYVMPQRYQQDEDRLIIIGHELWHCRYGEWHD